MAGSFRLPTSRQLGMERKVFWFNMISKIHPRSNYRRRHTVSRHTAKEMQLDALRRDLEYRYDSYARLRTLYARLDFSRSILCLMLLHSLPTWLAICPKWRSRHPLSGDFYRDPSIPSTPKSHFCLLHGHDFFPVVNYTGRVGKRKGVSEKIKRECKMNTRTIQISKSIRKNWCRELIWTSGWPNVVGLTYLVNFSLWR